MLINVCDPIFDVGIRLDGSCVSREDYPVENLVSPDDRLRRKGFLSETFIRPPVSFTVSFPFAFDVKYVIIGTRVGGQKSSGFQILAGRNDNVQRVCSTVTDKETIVFHDNNTDLSTFGDGYDKSRFNIAAGRNVRSADRLTVRIFKTANSIPAVGRLEIWGNVAFGVPKAVRQTLVSKWLESKKPKEKPQPVTTTAQPVNEKQDAVFTICDDFLDSITFEIMLFPMVLPGGKYVDKSTLEKCIEYDTMYGRTPCDPFTGISFTETLKPLPVPELKGRIDSFLIQHADNEHVKGLPRAVGKRSLSFYTERQAKLAKILCSACNGNSSLYTLPCKHVQCKNCLQSERIRCNVCNVNCNRNQIQKYHSNL